MRQPGFNPYAIMPPSQRLIAAARKAGVTGGKAEIDAWAKASGWLNPDLSSRKKLT